MEDKSNLEHLRAAFSRYLNVFDGIGFHRDSVALGAIVALVAYSRKKFAIGVHASSRTFEESLKRLMAQFEREFLYPIDGLNDIYHIPYDSPEIYTLLYESMGLHIDIDCELNQLLDDIYELSPRSQGVYFTPPSIAGLMAELVRISPHDAVFDPCAGSGGFLTAASERARCPFKFFGGEKNAFNRIVIRLRAILCDQNYVDFFGSIFSFAEELGNFDVIVSNPPVGKLRPNNVDNSYVNALNGVLSQEMSLNFVELGLQHLNDGGRAAYLVPVGILFTGGDVERVRKSWLDRKLLRTVISLPQNLLAHTTLKCAVVLFDKSSANEGVRLIRADDCYEKSGRRQGLISDEDISRIVQWSFERGLSDNVIDVSYEDLRKNNFCLVAGEYLHRDDPKIPGLAEKWVRFGEIAEVFQGASLARLAEGDTPVIRGKDIRTSRLEKDRLERKNLSNFGRPIKITKTGDILLQRIGANPAAYLIREGDEGIPVEDTVFIIRCKDLSFDQIDFICQFINSDQVASRISNARSYSVIPTQTLASIRSLEVPIPDEKIVGLVKEMNRLEESLRVEYEKAREYKRALFSGYDLSDISNRFEDARFTANALDAALRLKDDIKYRVRTQYPFPLAYAFRNIYLEREYAGIYERQMKYGEQLLSYLASLGLALVIKFCFEASPEGVGEILKDFKSYIERGISPGDYQSLLQKTCKLLQSESNPIAQTFSQVWYRAGGRKESDFAKESRENLVSKLNAFKHHRGPSNRHERKAGGELQAKMLETMLAYVEFLTDWELMRIDQIDKQWKGEKLEYSASLLKGDHPAFEQIQFNSEQNLSIDKLYIKLDSYFLCLYPLVSIAYNPGTRQEEIFTVDKAASGCFILKSFNSGSTIESREVRSDFLYWIEKYC